ncbi:MAG TPA: hypothetical protein VFG79_06635, partial [Solirubrobacter sp.]|nr:hypothetical protein [Solirubrobacter sp.]
VAARVADAREGVVLGADRDVERTRARARDEGGRQVADAALDGEARAVAWLHEALEWTTVSEQELLADGLTSDQLRALRLLSRSVDARIDEYYLAHLELIARAGGRSGMLARRVKLADLEDRLAHPYLRRDGWSPPYAAGLWRLRAASAELDRPAERV